MALPHPMRSWAATALAIAMAWSTPGISEPTASAVTSAPQRSSTNHPVPGNPRITTVGFRWSGWQVVVAQAPKKHKGAPGPVEYCFAKVEDVNCSVVWFGGNIDLGMEVKPDEKLGTQVIIGRTASKFGPSRYRVQTVVWAYSASDDWYEVIFAHESNRCIHDGTRYIEEGPLAGDIVISERTSRRPWPYVITVFEPSADGHYHNILAYEGQSRWHDGNRLEVIDAETLEIEKRLNVWKAGDPLPSFWKTAYDLSAEHLVNTPKELAACDNVSLQNGLMWWALLTRTR